MRHQPAHQQSHDAPEEYLRHLVQPMLETAQGGAAGDPGGNDDGGRDRGLAPHGLDAEHVRRDQHRQGERDRDFPVAVAADEEQAQAHHTADQHVDEPAPEKTAGLLLVGGHSNWKVPVALALTVLISSYVIRIKTMWRQAPITAAIVIAAGISQGSKGAGLESGLHKMAEVIFGCVVGMMVSWAMSKVWLIQPTAKEAGRTGNDAIASHE